jgi:aspartate racemase
MGGMGPAATVDFMARVIAMTDSGRDQEHVHMIVDQDPTVPNRQQAIRSGRDDVTPHLAAMAQRLENAGADFLVMVCNTAHVFLDGVRAATGIPFISIIAESVAEVERLSPAAGVVGVMATDGCLDTEIYQRAISASGRTPLVPESDDLRELMRLVSAIKAGDQGKSVAAGMQAVARRLVARGAEVIIGGCTEIPIVFDGRGCDVPVVSSTDVLARKTLRLAKGEEPLPGRHKKRTD